MKATLLFFLCLSVSLSAKPLKLKAAPFSVRPSFPATLIPEQAIPLSLPAKEWATFSIVEILPHGSQVEKDQVLVRFDDEAFQKKLRDAESAAKSAALALANAEADFASAEKYLPMQLQSAKNKAEEAAEAWEYFRKTRREAEVKEADLDMSQLVLRLELEREELKQLEKMYKADDLTENTEEIILKRQRETVKAYEISLELSKLSHKRKMEISLPREAVQLERDAQSTAIALAEQQQNLPRGLELKRIALEDARVSAKRSADALAALQAEKDLFVLKAPTSGSFYYGSMQEGRWVVGETTKALAASSVVAVKRPFAVVVPAKSKFLMETTVEESVMRVLKAEQKGFAAMTGRLDVSFPVTVLKTSPTPGLDGRYRVTLSAEFDPTIPVSAGMTCTVYLSVLEVPSAITIPEKALSAGANGTWEVKLQEAEDKIKSIPVKRGWTWGGNVQILSGLSEEQTIIVPGE